MLISFCVILNSTIFPALFTGSPIETDTMKLMKLTTGFLLLTAVLFSCTIQKRTHLPGYHVQWKASEKKVDNHKSVAGQDKMAEESLSVEQEAIAQNAPVSVSAVRISDASNEEQVQQNDQPERLTAPAVAFTNETAFVPELVTDKPVSMEQKAPDMKQSAKLKGDSAEVSLLFLIVAGVFIVIGIVLIALLTSPIPAIIFFVLGAIFLIIPLYLLISNI